MTPVSNKSVVEIKAAILLELDALDAIDSLNQAATRPGCPLERVVVELLLLNVVVEISYQFNEVGLLNLTNLHEFVLVIVGIQIVPRSCWLVDSLIQFTSE